MDDDKFTASAVEIRDDTYRFKLTESDYLVLRAISGNGYLCLYRRDVTRYSNCSAVLVRGVQHIVPGLEIRRQNRMMPVQLIEAFSTYTPGHRWYPSLRFTASMGAFSESFSVRISGTPVRCACMIVSALRD